MPGRDAGLADALRGSRRHPDRVSTNAPSRCAVSRMNGGSVSGTVSSAGSSRGLTPRPRVAESSRLRGEAAMRTQELLSLEGKRALITGGGRGLGRALAVGFAQAGADIVVVGAARGPAPRDGRRWSRAEGRAADVIVGRHHGRGRRPADRRRGRRRSTSWSTTRRSFRTATGRPSPRSRGTRSTDQPARAVPAVPALRAADGGARLGPDHQHRVGLRPGRQVAPLPRGLGAVVVLREQARRPRHHPLPRVAPRAARVRSTR